MNFEQPTENEVEVKDDLIISQLKQSIEQQANSPENASELLFARLSNPNIRKQVLDLIYQSGVWMENNIVINEPIKNEDGTWKRDSEGEMIFNKTPYEAKTKEKIEETYDKVLNRIKTYTEFDYTSASPHGGDAEEGEKLSLGWRLPSGEKPTVKQWGIIEAHEKGHSIRPYDGKFFRDYFSKAFDISVVDFTDKDYQEVQKLNEMNKGSEEDNSTESFDEQKERYFDYIFSGVEIVERMAQLKNYFGFKGDEEFTLEHLKYAKEHYVKDVGFDNRMSPFLKAITPETEGEFVRLMNCSGI